MNVLCIEQVDESPNRWEIVNINHIDITSVSRMGKDIDISDPDDDSLLLSQEEIIARLRTLDIVTDNYCHGKYVMLGD